MFLSDCNGILHCHYGCGSRVKPSKADRMPVIGTESRFNSVDLNHRRVHNMWKDLLINRRTESIRWSENQINF